MPRDGIHTKAIRARGAGKRHELQHIYVDDPGLDAEAAAGVMVESRLAIVARLPPVSHMRGSFMSSTPPGTLRTAAHR